MSRETKILHTADLHLGAPRTGVKNGKAEIEITLQRIIQLCKTEAIDFLLIAGDLFDSPFVGSDTIKSVSALFGQIPDTIIAISPGNHDPFCTGSVYEKADFPKNTVVFSGELEYIDFPEKGVRLWGAAFCDRYHTSSLLTLSNKPKTELIELCIMHANLAADGAEDVYNPISARQIALCGFDYLALGHIHKRTEIQTSGDTSFSYCGCPDGRGFDETGDLGVYIGHISKGRCSLRFHEMSSRKYIIDTVDISGCDNPFSASEIIFKHITEKFSKNWENNLYRINLCGSLSLGTIPDTNQIQDILSSKLGYIRIFDQTETDLADIEKIANETSLRGIFTKRMLEKLSSASPDSREKYKNALKIGLRAFGKGVKLNDN